MQNSEMVLYCRLIKLKNVVAVGQTDTKTLVVTGKHLGLAVKT